MSKKQSRPPTGPYSGGLYAVQKISLFMHNKKLLLACSIMLAFFSAALGLAPFVLVYISIKLMLEQPDQVDTALVALLGSTAAAALVLKTAATIASHNIAHRLAYGLLYDLRMELARKLPRLPLGYFQKRDTGQLKHTMNEQVERIEEGVAHLIPDTASSIAVPLAAYAVMFTLNWQMALTAAAAVPIIAIMYRIVQRRTSRYSSEYGKAQAQLTSALFRYVYGIKVIKTFARSKHAYKQFAKAAEDSELLTAELHLRSLPLKSATVILSRSPLLLVLPVGTVLYSNGSLTLAELIFFALIAMGIGKPLLKLMGTGGMVSFRIAAAVREVTELLDESELSEPEKPQRPENCSICLDQVTFGYGDNKVLHQVSLHIPEGKLTAIAGPSGAGKTTVAKLIARFWDADQGVVSIGGVDIRQISTASRMELISFVLQDEFLFEESVMENIRKGKIGSSDAEVIEAAKQAGCHSFIMQLPQQYNTIIRQQGKMLSGGQRQMIAIARALVKDAPIIIMDEASAFIDPENESKLRAALTALMKGKNGVPKTMLMIAHRLSSIVHADQIIVMSEGKVNSCGTHKQLLETSNLYEGLWQSYHTSSAIHSSGDYLSSQQTGMLRKLKNVAAPILQDDQLQSPGTLASEGIEEEAENLELLQDAPHPMKLWKSLKQLAAGALPQLKGSIKYAALESPFAAAAPLAAALSVYGLWSGKLQIAWIGIGLLLAALVGQGVCFYFGHRHALQLEGNIRVRLRKLLGIHLHKLPLGFYTFYPAATIESRMRVDAHNSALFHTITVSSVRGLLAALFTSALLFLLDWRLACIALAGVPLSLLVTATANRKFEAMLESQEQPRIEANKRITEYIEGLPIIQAFGLAGSQLNPFGKAMATYRDKSIVYNRKLAGYIAMDNAVFELGFAAVLAAGIAFYGQDGANPLQFGLILLLTLGLYEPLPLLEMAGFRRLLQRSQRNLREIFAVQPLPEPTSDKAVVPQGSDILFSNVSFSYGEQTILHDVTIRIPQQQTTAIVGPSGSGKTTLLNLISRFWDVQSGGVSVGGADVRQIRSEILMSQLSMVFQDVYLFKDTIMNNIRYGRPEASDEEVFAAAQAACCDSFIAKLPEGYNTIVREGGNGLSGGEKQRIAIARAIMKNCPILLLDEATASMDPDNELQVTQALQQLAFGKTTVIIAHRLHTIRNADQIIVLEQGQVADSGTHDQLIQRCSLYRRFWQEREQAETQTWRAAAAE